MASADWGTKTQTEELEVKLLPTPQKTVVSNLKQPFFCGIGNNLTSSASVCACHSFKMPLALAGGNKEIKWIGFSQNNSYYHFILRIAFSSFNSVFIGFG